MQISKARSCPRLSARGMGWGVSGHGAPARRCSLGRRRDTADSVGRGLGMAV